MRKIANGKTLLRETLALFIFHIYSSTKAQIVALFYVIVLWLVRSTVGA